MHKTNICFDTKVWNKNVPDIGTKIKKILKKSIESQRKLFKKNTEITVLLTNTNKMKFLNYKFRKMNIDTDVLSFPNEKPFFYQKNITYKKNIYLGDIVLSFDYINKQNIKFDYYFKKVLVHGFLHLIGYNHNNYKNFIRMEKAQIKIMNLK